VSKAAQISRSEPQPAAGRPLTGVETRERNLIQQSQFLVAGRIHSPDDKARRLIAASAVIRMIRRAPRVADYAAYRPARVIEVNFSAHQIRRDAALAHLALNSLSVDGNRNRNRLALAKLILDNAESLVKRMYEKIDDTVAKRLLLRRAIRRRCKRGGTRNIRGYNKRAALAIECSALPCASIFA
jgi:hypothetical protein